MKNPSAIILTNLIMLTTNIAPALAADNDDWVHNVSMAPIRTVALVTGAVFGTPVDVPQPRIRTFKPLASGLS